MVFSRTEVESVLHFKICSGVCVKNNLKEGKLLQASRHRTMVPGLGLGHWKKWMDGRDGRKWTHHDLVI